MVIIPISLLQTMEGTEDKTRDIQILETPDDIRGRRQQVLNRYTKFKDATKERKDRLEDAKVSFVTII